MNHSRRIPELDYQWQIDIQPKHVGSMNLATVAKARNTSEHNKTLHALLVVQDVQHLPHEGPSLTMIRLSQVDADYGDFLVHAGSPYRLRAM
jgi:hypothetical protein